MALDAIADLGARNVQITHENGCFALIREERRVRRFRAAVEPVEAVSALGAGDVLLAQWLAAQRAGKPADESLALAVAAGAASTLTVGAGRFDPGTAQKLLGTVAGRRAPTRVEAGSS